MRSPAGWSHTSLDDWLAGREVCLGCDALRAMQPKHHRGTTPLGRSAGAMTWQPLRGHWTPCPLVQQCLPACFHLRTQQQPLCSFNRACGQYQLMLVAGAGLFCHPPCSPPAPAFAHADDAATALRERVCEYHRRFASLGEAQQALSKQLQQVCARVRTPYPGKHVCPAHCLLGSSPGRVLHALPTHHRAECMLLA